MKKNIFLILLGLTLAPAVTAGEAPVMAAPTAPVIVSPRFETQPFSISLKGGLMHTEVGTYGDYDRANVPSLLYGGTLGTNWDYMQKWGFVHSLGFSVGVFQGNHTSSFSQGRSEIGNIIADDYGDCDVYAIPLTVSYDFKKDISDALSIYGGIRTGAMIRKTNYSGFYGGDQAPEADITWSGVSSTKVLPMLGLGLGVQMYFSDKWSLNLSYDLVWTFGKDCDRLNANSGTGGYYKWAPKATSMDHRYYGTISFGVTRSF